MGTVFSCLSVGFWDVQLPSKDLDATLTDGTLLLGDVEGEPTDAHLAYGPDAAADAFGSANGDGDGDDGGGPGGVPADATNGAAAADGSAHASTSSSISMPTASCSMRYRGTQMDLSDGRDAPLSATMVSAIHSERCTCDAQDGL